MSELNGHSIIPYSLEAEKAVIGCMLTEPRAVIDLAGHELMRSDFFVPAHQEVFSVIAHLYSRGDQIDIILVHQELQSRGLDQAVGSPGILAELGNSFATHLNVGSYIKIVKEKALLRQLQQVATIILEEIADLPESAIDTLSKAESLIRSVSRSIAVDDGIKRRSLVEYAEMEMPDTETLLGERWLCRTSAALFVAPSGIGKSSAGAQMDALWAIGKSAFDIRPAAPLRILTVQVENDEGDLIEMAGGVLDGLDLTDKERDLLKQNTRVITIPGKTGSAFFTQLRIEIKDFPCDLLRIDPTSAFNGAEIKDSAATNLFCRQLLQPLLIEHKLGCILTVHTPKTNFRDTSEWKPHDWAYAAAGAADWTNYARAVLVVDPCKYPVFKWIASKRGNRIGWMNEDGSKAQERFFQHNTGDNLMYWTTAAESSIKAASKKGKGDLLALLPDAGSAPVVKAEFLGYAQSQGFGRNASIALLNALIHEKVIQEVSIPNPIEGKGHRSKVGIIRLNLI